jgi:hypothetical protein
VADAQKWPQVTEATDRVRGLADIGELLLREIEPLVEGLTLRIRSDELMPFAKSLKFSQLADHLPSYLADIAGMLIAIEEAGGQPTALVADGVEIQRTVAERHGAQRARMGWTLQALRREYDLLRDELSRVIRRRSRSLPTNSLDEASAIVERFVEQAEEMSVRAFRRTTSARTGDDLPASRASTSRGHDVSSPA